MSDRTSDTTSVLPYAVAGRATVDLMPRVALMAAWGYPLLPLASLYLTWIAAWVTLGRRPQSSVDDPKHIGGLVDLPYIMTALLIGTMPMVMLIACIAGAFVTVWWVRRRGGGIFVSTAAVLALVGLYVGCVVLLLWDPLRVMNWYMD